MISAQAIVQEAINREVDAPSRSHGHSRPIKYINRLATIAFLQESPSFQAMSQAAVEMAFLANDIYSFKKEKMTGATQNNVITLIIQDPSTSICEGDLQGSFDYSNKLFQEALARFGTHKEVLRESIVSTQENHGIDTLNTFSQAMMDCVVGNIKWSMICRRYAVFECEQARNASEVAMI